MAKYISYKGKIYREVDNSQKNIQSIKNVVKLEGERVAHKVSKAFFTRFQIDVRHYEANGKDNYVIAGEADCSDFASSAQIALKMRDAIIKGLKSMGYKDIRIEPKVSGNRINLRAYCMMLNPKAKKGAFGE